MSDWKEVISCRVDGNPIAQPRPRAFARKFGDKFSARVYDPGTAEGWKSLIAEMIRSQIPAEPFAGAVSVSASFYFERPKSHFGTGKNAATLKESAAADHLKTPDPDNLIKAVMDCMTRLRVYQDDGQVTQLYVEKLWENDANRSGMQFTVRVKDPDRSVGQRTADLFGRKTV